MRALRHAEFAFLPGFNLLVGVNGVGKSTVLDVLRKSFSLILPSISASLSHPISFEMTDIRDGSKALNIDLTFDSHKTNYHCTIQKQRHSRFIKHSRGNQELIERPNIFTIEPTPSSLFRLAGIQELVIYFSPQRSVITREGFSRQKVRGGALLASADSLTPRGLRIREYAEWWISREQIAKESGNTAPLKQIDSIKKCILAFMEGFSDVYAIKKIPTLQLRKGRTKLDVEQLSDGERGILALVIDLARRLTLANPQSKEPLKETSAIVLIDEIELHLHPKWQRTIISRLVKTFPKCQFIATTHSPQVVSSLGPERIFLFEGFEVINPERTLGVDTNWILRHLMQAGDRPLNAAKAIQQTEALIKNGKFKKAQKLIVLNKSKWDLPEWSVLDARLAKLKILTK